MGERLVGQEVLARVEAFLGEELLEVESIFVKELESRVPCVRDIFAHVARFRGKRLRPVLLLLAGSAAGGIKRDHLVLGAVVEMIHTATLVHDDVLDDAETRRHVATVNARWNTESSVLFGDYLFTHAFHLASSLQSTEACRLIGRATNIVCEGELAQIHERGNLDLGEEQYTRIIDAKTAELCAVSCYLGGHSADADAKVTEALEQFGRSLGIAFQIADDLLDILGSEQQVGKTLGSDVEQQKLTLPVIRLLAVSDEAQSSRVRDLLSQQKEDAIPELLACLEQSDAVDYTRRRAREYAESARQSLSALPASPAKSILMELTDFVVQRTF